jgi:hypothetical protein
MLSYLFKQKLVFLALVIWALFLGISPNLSQAALIESKSTMEGQYEDDLVKIKTFLEQELVQKQLKRARIDKEELLNRIEKLNENELRELALRCDKIKVGSGAGGVFLVILIIGLVIVAILYFTNYTIKVEPRDAVPRRY